MKSLDKKHYNISYALLFIKVPVKSKLSMCSEFVTPQKNVLLATKPNLND